MANELRESIVDWIIIDLMRERTMQTTRKQPHPPREIVRRIRERETLRDSIREN